MKKQVKSPAHAGIIHEMRGAKNGRFCNRCGDELKGNERFNCPQCLRQIEKEVNIDGALIYY